MVAGKRASAMVLVAARVGPDHLNRRRGFRYAWAELFFFWRCAVEGQFSWPHSVFMTLLRVPWRLLPRPCLTAVMHLIRQHLVR